MAQVSFGTPIETQPGDMYDESGSTWPPGELGAEEVYSTSVVHLHDFKFLAITSSDTRLNSSNFNRQRIRAHLLTLDPEDLSISMQTTMLLNNSEYFLEESGTPIIHEDSTDIYMLLMLLNGNGASPSFREGFIVKYSKSSGAITIGSGSGVIDAGNTNFETYQRSVWPTSATTGLLFTEGRIYPYTRSGMSVSFGTSLAFTDILRAERVHIIPGHSDVLVSGETSSGSTLRMIRVTSGGATVQQREITVSNFSWRDNTTVLFEKMLDSNRAQFVVVGTAASGNVTKAALYRFVWNMSNNLLEWNNPGNAPPDPFTGSNDTSYQSHQVMQADVYEMLEPFGFSLVDVVEEDVDDNILDHIDALVDSSGRVTFFSDVFFWLYDGTSNGKYREVGPNLAIVFTPGEEEPDIAITTSVDTSFLNYPTPPLHISWQFINFQTAEAFNQSAYVETEDGVVYGILAVNMFYLLSQKVGLNWLDEIKNSGEAVGFRIGPDIPPGMAFIKKLSSTGSVLFAGSNEELTQMVDGPVLSARFENVPEIATINDGVQRKLETEFWNKFYVVDSSQVRLIHPCDDPPELP